MDKKARIEKVRKALEPPAQVNISVVWSEEERQALIEKYGEDGWLDIYWEAVSDEPKGES